jgi:SAM-dependent methyltransferase
MDDAPVLVGPDRLHGVAGRFEVAVCGRCGAGVTLPRVPAEELAAFYPAGYAPYDAASGRVVGMISTAIQRWQGWRALRTAPLRETRTIGSGRALDVGCGRGDLGAHLVGHGWRVTGIEPSAGACAVASARGLDARQGTLEEVALEEGAYDVAVFQHSLEHVVDPVVDLRRVRAALRDGGLVLVSVPHFGSWQRRRFRDRWYQLDLPRHRIHFTRAALADALAAAGLRTVQLSTSTSAVGLPATLQYAAFGRCLFPDGLRLRVASGLCALALPIGRLADRLGGDGDVLHAVAVRHDA